MSSRKGSWLINFITLVSLGFKILDIMATMPRVMQEYDIKDVSDVKNIAGKLGI